MCCSPNVNTGVNARLPQIRHVLRVTNIGEKIAPDMGKKLTDNPERGKE
jgi:hypothetical protein